MKESVALLITDGDGRFLAVRRSDDDTTLPGVWGLPAASLRPGETAEVAALRAARDKLGLEVRLREEMGEATGGAAPVRLRAYTAEITAGTPSLAAADPQASRYAALRMTPDLRLLLPAARAGSLCSQVCLRWSGIDWEEEDEDGAAERI
ncbi:MAG TPA: NUDIX domain-containing protein [Candidatus Dormibacteraeota bacterium]|nr:NUDIX domain-containing protein [Candidatus Dormibacteraeota bacterium]